jgi:hypothetical protein
VARGFEELARDPASRYGTLAVERALSLATRPTVGRVVAALDPTAAAREFAARAFERSAPAPAPAPRTPADPGAPSVVKLGGGAVDLRAAFGRAAAAHGDMAGDPRRITLTAPVDPEDPMLSLYAHLDFGSCLVAGGAALRRLLAAVEPAATWPAGVSDLDIWATGDGSQRAYIAAMEWTISQCDPATHGYRQCGRVKKVWGTLRGPARTPRSAPHPRAGVAVDVINMAMREVDEGASAAAGKDVWRSVAVPRERLFAHTVEGFDIPVCRVGYTVRRVVPSSARGDAPGAPELCYVFELHPTVLDAVVSVCPLCQLAAGGSGRPGSRTENRILKYRNARGFGHLVPMLRFCASCAAGAVGQWTGAAAPQRDYRGGLAGQRGTNLNVRAAMFPRPPPVDAREPLPPVIDLPYGTLALEGLTQALFQKQLVAIERARGEDEAAARREAAADAVVARVEAKARTTFAADHTPAQMELAMAELHRHATVNARERFAPFARGAEAPVRERMRAARADGFDDAFAEYAGIRDAVPSPEDLAASQAVFRNAIRHLRVHGGLPADWRAKADGVREAAQQRREAAAEVHIASVAPRLAEAVGEPPAVAEARAGLLAAVDDLARQNAERDLAAANAEAGAAAAPAVPPPVFPPFALGAWKGKPHGPPSHYIWVNEVLAGGAARPAGFDDAFAEYIAFKDAAPSAADAREAAQVFGHAMNNLRAEGALPACWEEDVARTRAVLNRKIAKVAKAHRDACVPTGRFLKVDYEKLKAMRAARGAGPSNPTVVTERVRIPPPLYPEIDDEPAVAPAAAGGAAAVPSPDSGDGWTEVAASPANGIDMTADRDAFAAGRKGAQTPVEKAAFALVALRHRAEAGEAVPAAELARADAAFNAACDAEIRK